MNMVDTAKSVRHFVASRTSGHPVVFHHVPKCGGTSVGRALRKRYLFSQTTIIPESSYRAFAAFTGRNDRQQLLIDVLDLREQMLLYWLYEDVKCISAHVRFSQTAYDLFSENYKFITVLREPVARFISHYFWSHNRSGAHARIEEDFAAFLQTDRAARLGATYVEYFCGLGKDADLRSSDTISTAIKNLRNFDVVGRLDDLEKFKSDLRNHLGIALSIGHENQMRQPRALKADVVTSELRQKVEQLCAPDLTVWNAVAGA